MQISPIVSNRSFSRMGLWIVMDYVEGCSLTNFVSANLLTEGQIAAVSREIAQGLQYLHEHGVVHCDIKSNHVLLSLAGDVKLSMYGVYSRDKIPDKCHVPNDS